jgi:nickel-type superoxide dismutase maturation protease
LVGRSSSRRSRRARRFAVDGALRIAPRAARAIVATIDRLLPYERFRVEGASMQPTYFHGERVIVDRRAYRRRPPAPGDVVVLRDPEEPARHLVKRVAGPPPGAEPRRDAVYVLGDNPDESRDSRDFGPVPLALIIGRVRLRY